MTGPPSLTTEWEQFTRGQTPGSFWISSDGERSGPPVVRFPTAGADTRLSVSELLPRIAHQLAGAAPKSEANNS